MVIDDDPGVGMVLSAYLEKLGAEVAACEDPRDGLAVLEETPQGWSALITDYDMPHMNGGALVAQGQGCGP